MPAGSGAREGCWCLLSSTRQNAFTQAGSSWVPLTRSSSARASSTDMASVGTLRSQGIEGVSDGDDARLQRYLLAGDAIRVARAFEALVMVPDDVRDLRQAMQVPDYLPALRWVLLDLRRPSACPASGEYTEAWRGDPVHGEYRGETEEA